MARVAGPEDEAAWLRLARALSADALEKQVRRVDRGSLEAGVAREGLEEVDEDGRPLGRETFWIRPCSPGVHGHWHYARMLANRVTGRACPPGEVLELVVAEALSLIPAPEVGAEGEVPTPCKTQAAGKEGVPPRLRALPDIDLEAPAECVLPEPVAGLLAGLDETDAFELDRRLRALVALEQRLDARMGELLAEVARGRSHRLLGHRTLGAFARERLGISPSKARALLRLERASDVCPELRRAYREGRLSWVKAQALVPLLSLGECSGFRKDWLAWSQRATTRRLEDDVAFSLTLRETNPAAWAEAGGLPEEARSPETRKCQLRAKARDSETGSYLFIVAPREVTRLARATLCTVRRRIERLVGRPVSESEGFEAMLSHALESWGHPGAKVKHEHRIYARDGWRCAAPGCSSYRSLHAHHIHWRSQGGPDDAENLITLCAYHHQRCIHASPTLLRITGRAPDALRFEMPWGSYRSGDVAVT